MIYFIIFRQNEVDDSIIETIQGLYVELKIKQKNYCELVITPNLIVSYPLKISQNVREENK